MNYIVSKYTYQFISTIGDFLIFCSRTTAFLKVSELLYRIIQESKIDPNNISSIDSEMLHILIDKKVIVLDFEDSDYLLEHEFKANNRSFSLDKLGLIIAPTTQCNMQCPYCFEPKKETHYMNDDVINDLIYFLNRHNKSRTMELLWYGGEPLLALDSITKILDRVTQEVDIKIVRHGIITNGSLFNDNVIQLFKKYPLDFVQITLDGSKNRHDKLRCLSKGDIPTYDTIIQNIGSILKELPNTQIHVRVNIDKSNIHDFIDIKKELGEKWDNRNLIVYPGILRIDDETGKSISCAALNKYETANLLFELNEKGIYNTDIYPKLSIAKGCTATRINSHIIGPKGEIYKCWNDVSDQNKIVGYINHAELTNKTLFYRYISGSKWYHDHCNKCFFLPICNGKCAWYIQKNRYEGGKYILCDCMQKTPGLLHKTLEHWCYNDIPNKL